MSIASGTGAPVSQPPTVPATGQPSGPVVVGLSPPDDATDVPTAPNLIAQFDKAVTLGTGNVTLQQASDNSTVETWDVVADAGTGAGQVNVFSATQMTLRLTAPLAAATEYYVVWDAGAVKDIGGNPCAAQTSTTLWSFTTA